MTFGQKMGGFATVSISHRYGSTDEEADYHIHLIFEFQSLIGTVQQQCLLRFMFSLYLISAVFQSFSPKKSVNLFIANSRKALILLAFLFLPKLTRRFTDFSTVFAVFGTFPCCFCPGGLDFTGLEVHRLFLQIF